MAFSSNTHGIARIIQPMPDGRGENHVGMAFVVGPRHVMTCCHVLNDALGRQNRLDPERPPPDTCFSIRFPYESNAKGSGGVAKWGLELGQPRDVAVLKLDQDAPKAAGLAAFSRVEVQGDIWSCIGWDSSGTPRGAKGEFGPILPGDVRQLNGQSGLAVRIAGGYSGAGVWTDKVEAFVGMVVTRDRDQFENGLAYAVPTKVLLEVWPHLSLAPIPLSSQTLMRPGLLRYLLDRWLPQLHGFLTNLNWRERTGKFVYLFLLSGTLILVSWPAGEIIAEALTSGEKRRGFPLITFVLSLLPLWLVYYYRRLTKDRVAHLILSTALLGTIWLSISLLNAKSILELATYIPRLLLRKRFDLVLTIITSEPVRTALASAYCLLISQTLARLPAVRAYQRYLQIERIKPAGGPASDDCQADGSCVCFELVGSRALQLDDRRELRDMVRINDGLAAAANPQLLHIVGWAGTPTVRVRCEASIYTFRRIRSELRRGRLDALTGDAGRLSNSRQPTRWTCSCPPRLPSQ